MTSSELETIEAQDLLEQHPELRLALVPLEQAGTRAAPRRPASPGAYEIWRVEAMDASRSGVVIVLAVGDPLDPAYRQAARRYLAGQIHNPASIRPARYATARAAVFHRGRLIARSLLMPPENSVSLSGPTDSLDLELGGALLRHDGDAWTATFRSAPDRLGFGGLLKPGAAEAGRLAISVSIRPAFDTFTLQRASMPDSPSGARHDWFMACPNGAASGRIELALPRAQPLVIDLQGATASVDHFWGDGPMGEGMRRWFVTRLHYADGAAVAELAIVRKFIQIAGTVVRFRPGALPEVQRAAGPEPTTFQRSSWLLAYPLHLRWRDPLHRLDLTHDLDRLADASPGYAFAFTQASLKAGLAPNEIAIGPEAGTFEMFQPARVQWRLWRRLTIRRR